MMLVIAFFVAMAVTVRAYDSNYVHKLSQRYVDFCGAAYCTDPILKRNTVDDWSCSACKNYPHTVAKSFHGANRTDANGFVAYDSDANEIVVSFSGTDPFSIQNWIDDLDFIKTSYPYCSSTKCQVHEGFYKAYLSVDSQVKSLVNNYASSHPTASLAITGHSLGAAMAAHCAAELVNKGYKIKTAYTYGMPRVGDENFEKWYVSVVPGTFRVVHRKDPVPHVPYENWGFHHMAYEVFYLEDPEKYKVCNFEGEDKSCSDQYLADVDVGKSLPILFFN
jgi:ribosomal protein L37AE/L43A